jgi:hypothetical protein
MEGVVEEPYISVKETAKILSDKMAPYVEPSYRDNDDEISDVDEVLYLSNDDATPITLVTTQNTNADAKPTCVPEIKTRPIPRKYAENQKKFMEAQEKEQKLLGIKKNKNKNNPHSKKTASTNNGQNTSQSVQREGMRRVVVAGKIKYIPMINCEQDNTPTEIVDSVSTNDKLESTHEKLESTHEKLESTVDTPVSTINNVDTEDEPPAKRIPAGIAKAATKYEENRAKQRPVAGRSKSVGTNRHGMPSRYVDAMDKKTYRTKCEKFFRSEKNSCNGTNNSWSWIRYMQCQYSGDA